MVMGVGPQDKWVGSTRPSTASGLRNPESVPYLFPGVESVPRIEQSLQAIYIPETRGPDRERGDREEGYLRRVVRPDH